MEHHWGFDYRSRTTTRDRNKRFGAGTEPHAVVGAGAEVSTWPFPLYLTLSLRSSGPTAGRESKTAAGPSRDHLEPRSASVFRHKVTVMGRGLALLLVCVWPTAGSPGTGAEEGEGEFPTGAGGAGAWLPSVPT